MHESLLCSAAVPTIIEVTKLKDETIQFDASILAEMFIRKKVISLNHLTLI